MMASGVSLATTRVSDWFRVKTWQVQNAWRRLTEGAELDELWTQFLAEAHASTRLYSSEVDWEKVERKDRWKQPLEITRLFFWSLLKKLSPPRRMFLLLTLVFVFLSLTNVHFFPLTKNVEFILASAGLLLLLALELADRVTMKRDIEIAREIQRWLVPRKPPDVPGVDLAFAMRPAKMVAGDYYDAFRRAVDGRLLIAVADVAGKSVPAAMLMATFQASLHTLAGARSSLADLVVGLNRYACAHSLNGRRFTTAFLAELDPNTGDMSYVCAGHNAPILRRRDASIERLKAGSLPLGIDLDESYESGRTTIAPGDLLVLFTDGVVEAVNQHGERFGEPRLLELLNEPREKRAAQTLSHILRRLDEFMGQTRQQDDITCLVLRRS